MCPTVLMYTHWDTATNKKRKQTPNRKRFSEKNSSIGYVQSPSPSPSPLPDGFPMPPSSQHTQHTTSVFDLVLRGGLGCQLSLGLCVVLGCVDTVLECVSFHSLQNLPFFLVSLFPMLSVLVFFCLSSSAPSVDSCLPGCDAQS